MFCFLTSQSVRLFIYCFFFVGKILLSFTAAERCCVGERDSPRVYSRNKSRAPHIQKGAEKKSPSDGDSGGGCCGRRQGGGRARTFIIGSCGPFRPPRDRGVLCRRAVGLNENLWGAHTTEFQRRERVSDGGGLQRRRRFRVLTRSSRRRMFPLMSGHARDRGVLG